MDHMSGTTEETSEFLSDLLVHEVIISRHDITWRRSQNKFATTPC
uniref:Uncharacterized protein n=1 Tax=Onchocerca volvulus TaxID=6282 RepID=A0A8R1TUP9_ONCVO